MTTALVADEISELIREIWTSLVPAEGELCRTDDVSHAARQMTAAVGIFGAWNGLATLSCSVRAGRQAASAMFDMAEDELTADEISDAVGELANVVGGNLKSLLPAPSELSIPTFHEDGFDPPAGLELALEVQFSWMAEPVVVSVFEGPAHVAA